MGSENRHFDRKRPVHLPVREAPNRTVIVYLTICAEKRKPLFCRPAISPILLSAWEQGRAWSVGRYVLMPDHMHLFCRPSEWEVTSLGKWVAFWKSIVSRQWPYPDEQPIWQRSFWDTQLRSQEKYEEKWEYVRNNPVRAGLAADADKWIYQGEMTVLDWHD